MSGVIQQVLTQHPEGGPLGFNFVMTASQKPLTVNAGPMLTDKVREQLRAGQSIEVTGLTRTINGQSYLLAREMVVGGQIIQPRNKNGFLVHSPAELQQTCSAIETCREQSAGRRAMKNIRGVLLVGCFAILGLVGCGGSSSPTPPPPPAGPAISVIFGASACQPAYSQRSNEDYGSRRQ